MLSYFIFGDFRFSPLKLITSVIHTIPNIALLACRFISIRPDSLQKNTSKGSVHYEKSIWNPSFVHSLPNEPNNTDITQVEELKKMLKYMLNDVSVGLLEKLVLIDDLERLGVGYHFEKEIEVALDIFSMSKDICIGEDLHLTALYYRLLRKHGYKISPDVFNHFKDEEGNFRLNLCEDVKGMISLYEACHFCLEGENILDEAKEFAVKHLSLHKENKDLRVAEEVSRALELPLHWRMPRLEARCYINTYEEKENMIPVVLKLAQLDFNLLQAIHQTELSNLSRWWKSLGLSDKMSPRDRLGESYLWYVGLTNCIGTMMTMPQPRYHHQYDSITLESATS